MSKDKIILLPFPFDDLSTTKVRPALCLTDPIGDHQHIVVAFITSRIPDTPLPTDIILTTTHPDFGVTGLRISSTIQLHRLMTVTTGIIQRELGTLSLSLQKQVKEHLKTLFIL